MSFYDLICTRESCRAYSDKKVPRELIEKCVDAARLAPSACNSQPWHFYAVLEESVLGILRKTLQSGGGNRFADKVSTLIVVTEEEAMLSAAVKSSFPPQTWAQSDIGHAVMQLCLAASQEGLSTCIMGWFDKDEAARAINLPENSVARLIVAIGYAENRDAPRTKTRKPIEDILTFV